MTAQGCPHIRLALLTEETLYVKTYKLSTTYGWVAELGRRDPHSGLFEIMNRFPTKFLVQGGP